MARRAPEGKPDQRTQARAMTEPAGVAPEPQEIDLENWPRRDHFHFFLPFTEPFFSITAEVDCSALVQSHKQAQTSPTFGFWHGVLAAANSMEAFRLRIREGKPVLYPAVHLSPTVLREDETFGITFVPYKADYREFEERAREAVEKIRQTRGLNLDPKARRIDLIHFSTIPWFKFTSISHARPLLPTESEPKVTLGRFQQCEGRFWIPVSVTAHHSLMDGLHVARFLERLEERYANW